MDDDPFIDRVVHRDQPMTRVTDPINPISTGSPLAGVPVSDERSQSNAVRESLSAKQVCPFCGSQNLISANSGTNSNGPCPRCTMEDTAATRQATKARIGPWHVLQTRNPAAPGMRYATLLALVGKGQITARSVVRGPTTHQLWRYAAHVKGVSREFGVCYSCGESVDKTAAHCPHCDRAQEPVGNPDTLLEAREPVAVPGPLSPPMVVADVTSATDPYALVTRVPPAQPMLSHAERLRTGGENRTDVRRRPDGKALSAMELAAALQVSPPPPPPAGRPIRTALVTLVIVLVMASLIIGYARPDIRRSATDWVSSETAQIQQKVANFHLQKPPPADQTTEADGSTNSQIPVETPPSGGSNAVSPIPQQVTAPAVDTTPLSQPPVAQSVTPPAPTPTASVPDASASTPVQASETAAARPSVQSDHPTLVGTALSSSEIWALHSRGLDAEGKQDWAEAIRCYEQIEQSPKDTWPSDVRIRLANARRQLNK
jgi:hypothetical protein